MRFSVQVQSTCISNIFVVKKVLNLKGLINHIFFFSPFFIGKRSFFLNRKKNLSNKNQDDVCYKLKESNSFICYVLLYLIHDFKKVNIWEQGRPLDITKFIIHKCFYQIQRYSIIIE